MNMHVTDIFRYPVKGLSPEPLQTVTLTPGEGLPGDRRYALAHGSSTFDPLKPTWMPKHNFLMLSRNPRLAALTTHFEEETQTLTIERGGKQVARANLSSPIGRTRMADFFAAYLKDEARGAPRLVEAPGHMFSDAKAKVLSIINRESLRDLERVAGQALDPRRFRANLVIDGAPAWEELTWAGRQIRIGEARLNVLKPIDRCAATSANPDSGEVDINLPKALQKGFNHVHFGVYARVEHGGEIRVGTPLTLTNA